MKCDRSHKRDCGIRKRIERHACIMWTYTEMGYSKEEASVLAYRWLQKEDKEDDDERLSKNVV